MAEASTRRARTAIDATASGVDRLSILPDEILHTIMSFLPARQAVQTSALSRRWRELWRSMPCLHIDIRDFRTSTATPPVHQRWCAGGVTRPYNPNPRPFQDGWTKFENFTTNLLMFHSAATLDRFRLRISGEDHELEAERWIRRGIKYNPAVLEVTLTSVTGIIPLPPLGPSAVAAPCRLRRLNLHGLRLDDGFADHLRSRCPVLEDLQLKGCDCLFRELVSTSLKSLVIDAGDRGFRVQLVVTAPALVSIRLAFGQSTDPRSFVLNGAEGSLSQAWIGESFGSVNNNLSRLLGSMCNIRTLDLWRFGYRIDKLLEDERKEFPKLHNLTTLLMGQCDMREEFDILRFFMENVPSLEKVTLRHCKENRAEEKSTRVVGLAVNMCRFSVLQIQSGCLGLEDLELKNCYCTFREIASHTLKTLKMDGCSIDVPVADDPDRVFVIRVPALVSLHLSVYISPFGVSVNEASNLVLASIRFHVGSGRNIQRNVRKLLDGLSSARNLELTYLKTVVPSVDETTGKFPAFSNLKTLLLDTCDLSDNFKTLGQFLHNAPNLEKLTLKHCKLSKGQTKKVKSMRKTLKCQNLLSFKCSNLKLVEIKGSEGNIQQLFDLLFGIWENLLKATVVLTKDD
ncbi:hypothetical protein PR202_gb15582 [Eleusine coracana subsp. coracana]|uniref:F-box domain-containing protein n=1 Tax=Eleusine coracana subsp. coracana TaxID=191504 RepID=A0AAV5EYE0_ELECO|nr:hypothetical protein PR202_gb15582 [Eleusine coracana subsp. coracana]